MQCNNTDNPSNIATHAGLAMISQKRIPLTAIILGLIYKALTPPKPSGFKLSIVTPRTTLYPRR